MTEPRKDAGRRRSMLAKGRRAADETVRIPKNQTAELRVFGNPKDPRSRLVIFHCPSCPDRDTSRLVMVHLQMTARDAKKAEACRSAWPGMAGVLLHVTRDQALQILRDIDTKPGFRARRSKEPN